MSANWPNLRKLQLSFYLFMFFYLFNLVIPLVGPYSYTERMWLFTSFSVGLLSIYFLVTYGLPGKKNMAIGLCLAILAGIFRPFSGLITFVTFLASLRILQVNKNEPLILKNPAWISILLGLGVGVVLGTINLFLGGSQGINFAPSFFAFLTALNPGIFEEVAFRFFVYAFSLHLLGGKITEQKEQRWIYVLMIIPHVLLHFPDTYFVEGVFRIDLGTLLISPTILALIFGLPMALLMVKRDLTSAIITHTVVDFIRFVFLGLPF